MIAFETKLIIQDTTILLRLNQITNVAFVFGGCGMDPLTKPNLFFAMIAIHFAQHHKR